jgi:hypothetical protein
MVTRMGAASLCGWCAVVGGGYGALMTERTPQELAELRARFLAPDPTVPPQHEQRWAQVQVALSAGLPADVAGAWAVTGQSCFRVPSCMDFLACVVVDFIPPGLVVIVGDEALLACESTLDLLGGGKGLGVVEDLHRRGPGVYRIDADALITSLVDEAVVNATYPEGWDPTLFG